MMDQLKNQDPLNPSDPTQYLSELASFSSLEQETHDRRLDIVRRDAAGLDVGTRACSATRSATTIPTAPRRAASCQKVDFTSSGPIADDRRRRRASRSASITEAT